MKLRERGGGRLNVGLWHLRGLRYERRPVELNLEMYLRRVIPRT